MIGMFMAAIAGGVAALLAYEIIQEARGGSEKLHDRYHE